MRNLPLPAFFALAFLHFLGIALSNNTLVFVTKPLLMPLLAVWLISTTQFRNEHAFLRRTVLSALVLSTFGDVFLMFQGALFFLLGLAAFLLAHLFYIGAFSSISSFKNGFLKQNLWWIFPFLIFALLLLTFLWKDIPPGMKTPVAVYAGVISVMALSVVNLKGKVPDATFWTLMTGALLFLISDSVLATAKFSQPFAGSRLTIMATYIGGQYLLVRGVVNVLKTYFS